MSTAPDIPYTERDVREDPTLVNYAESYLVNYGGSFDPLVRARYALIHGRGLNSAQVRTVLNCMRNDTNVSALLPTPRPPTLTLVENKPTVSTCDIVTSHHAHYFTVGRKSSECPGIPFEIERVGYSLPAKVKWPYARARTGRLLHLVDTDIFHDVYWHPNTHRLGFYSAPSLIVKLKCRYPSYIQNPILHKRALTDVEYAILELAPCKYCEEES